MAAILSLLLAAAGLNLHELAAFGCLAAVCLLWGALLLWPSSLRLSFVLAGMITLGLCAGFIALKEPGRPMARAADTSPVGTAKTLAPGIPGFAFNPIDQPIPYCNTFHGSGTVPPGDEVLIFEQPSDGAGHPAPPDGPVYYDGTGTNDAHDAGWTAANIEVDTGKPSDDGDTQLLYALVMPTNIAQYVVETAGDEATAWKMRELPPAAMIVATAQIDLTRNNDDSAGNCGH